MWAALREELNPKGLEVVTVGLDVLGADGCRPFIEAAQPKHPSLLDPHHLLADRFGVTNIPQSIWIDEDFRIVRPVEAAPAPPKPGDAPRFEPPAGDMPQRMMDMMQLAMRIPNDSEVYHAALRDWVEKGADSEFVMSAERVVERSQPRDASVALGHAHFDLATELERLGDHTAAIEHFRKAHELVPDSWTFRRQAWSLEMVEAAGPFARFWQGPKPDDPESWPYEGDWSKDVAREGPENYSIRFEP